jgi:hypothetical protein
MNRPEYSASNYSESGSRLTLMAIVHPFKLGWRHGTDRLQ